MTIQGYEGSFHQVAARQFFGKDVDVIPCATFRDVVRIGEDAKAVRWGSHGHGKLHRRKYPSQIIILLQKSKLQVIGEVYLSISQKPIGVSWCKTGRYQRSA